MNYLHRWIIVGIAGASVCGASWAATIVERRDIDGKEQKLIMDKQHVRINEHELNYYTQINLDERKVYLVNKKKKRIIEMDIKGTPPKLPQNMPKPPKPPWGDSVRAKLVKQGQGPKIAGYLTMHYQVNAFDPVNARSVTCSDNYFSEKAAQKVAYLNEFIKIMFEMSNSRKINGMPVSFCQQAFHEVEVESMKLGIPMKTVIKGGKMGDRVKHEITRIQTDAKVSADTFVLPRYDDKISEQEMRKKMQKAMMKRMEEAKQRGDQRYGPPGGSYNPPR